MASARPVVLERHHVDLLEILTDGSSRTSADLRDLMAKKGWGGAWSGSEQTIDELWRSEYLTRRGDGFALDVKGWTTIRR